MDRIEAAHRETQIATWTIVLGVATIVLATGSAATLVFLHEQGQELKAQRLVLEKHSLLLADSVRVTQNNAISDLRAYLILGTTGPRAASENHGDWHLQIENVGRTPANRVVVEWRVFTVDVESGNSPGSAPIYVENHGVIAPGQRAVLRIPTNEWPWEERKVLTENGKLKLCATGTIRYRDAFEQDRSTAFCRFAEWDELGHPSRDSAAPEGNDAR